MKLNLSRVLKKFAARQKQAVPREELFNISRITDDDTGMYEIDEVDYGITSNLDVYIGRLGVDGMRRVVETMNGVIAYMQDHLITEQPMAMHSEPDSEFEKPEVEMPPSIIRTFMFEERSLDMCPRCREAIGEKELFEDEDGLMYHRPCMDDGPIQMGREAQEEAEKFFEECPGSTDVEIP